MVKFSDKLVGNRVAEWSEYYVDYDRLKALIKSIEKRLRERGSFVTTGLRRGSHSFDEETMPRTRSLSEEQLVLESSTPSSRLTAKKKFGSSYGTMSPGKSFRARTTTTTTTETKKMPTKFSSEDTVAPSPASSNAELNNKDDDGRGSHDVLKEFHATTTTTTPETEEVKNVKAEEEEEEEEDPDEEFFEALTNEGDKVESFFLREQDEFSGRLVLMSETIAKLKAKRRKKSIELADSDDDDTPTRGAGGKKKKKNGGEEEEEDIAGDKTLVRDIHVLESLKRSFVELYRQMNYLLNFTILNYTAFVKISKKHDKQLQRDTKRRAMAIVHSYTFGEASRLKSLIADLERLFARSFHNNNLTLARSDLLVKNRPKADLEMMHVGFRLGVVVVLMCWVAWVLVMDALIKPKTAQLPGPVFIVYRGMSTFIIGVWLWGTLLYVWESARVNYVFLFEFESRHAPHYLDVLRRASTLSIVYLINLLFYVKIARGELVGIEPTYAAWLPYALFVYLAVLAMSTRLGGDAFTALGSVVLAPFTPVTFFQSFVGDVLTSLVRPLVDLAFSLCFFLSGEWMTSTTASASLPASRSMCMTSSIYQGIVVPFVISLPLWWRFAQCIRRYHDTKKRSPNLYNAFKYMIAYSVVLLGALHQPSVAFHRVWLGAAVISTLITFSWDVWMDWGLGRHQHAFLRDRLMFARHWPYYLAMSSDLFLRFLWVLTLVPRISTFFAGGEAPGVAVDQSPLAMYSTALIGWLELCRRCMWAVFRVEHEHLVNTQGFRRVDFVPLHFDSPLEHEEVKQIVSPLRRIRFYAEVVFFFSVVIGIAIFVFRWQVEAELGKGGSTAGDVVGGAAQHNHLRGASEWLGWGH